MDVPLTRDVDGYGRPCSLRGHDLPSTSSPRNRRPDTNAPNNETTFIRILCSIHRRHILYILEEKKKRGCACTRYGHVSLRADGSVSYDCVRASCWRPIHSSARHTYRAKKKRGPVLVIPPKPRASAASRTAPPRHDSTVSCFFFFKKEQMRCQKCRVDKLDMHFAPFWLRSKYLKFRLNEISVCRAAPSPNVQTHPIRYTRLTQKTELALRRNRVIGNFVLAVLKRHTSFVTLALF